MKFYQLTKDWATADLEHLLLKLYVALLHTSCGFKHVRTPVLFFL